MKEEPSPIPLQRQEKSKPGSHCSSISSSTQYRQQQCCTVAFKQKCHIKTVAGLLHIQKFKVENAEGEFVEIAVAMIDSGSNTSILSKAAVKKLGLSGPQTQLTMNLAGGSKRSETSEIIRITMMSRVEEHVKKPLLVHTVSKPCSSKQYPHLKPVIEKLHLSGGSVDLLLRTDLQMDLLMFM